MKRVCSIAAIVYGIFGGIAGTSAAAIESNPEVLHVAVLGLGGRAQGLLLECMKLESEVHKEIRVVAVCDNHTEESLKFFADQLEKDLHPLSSQYRNMMTSAIVYQDNEEGLTQLFQQHAHLDRILITSSNDRHFTHLCSALKHSSCKNVFIEKPLFRSLDEFVQCKPDISQSAIQVGLTLRYANMTRLAVEKLEEYKPQLGQLLKVRAWERVNFPHGWSIIMMNWRRYHSLSGGLLLEKSVHDLDLSLFFMQAVGVNPTSLSITTDTSHDFYKRARKDEILARILQDEPLRKQLESWDAAPWQRVVLFSYNASGAIDWTATVGAFFQEFPADEHLTQSDIIPDRHKIMAKMQSADGSEIDFELEVKLNEFSRITERGTHLAFANGHAVIDVEQGNMEIQTSDGVVHSFDLSIKGQPHAGGDVYVAHTILGTLPEGQYKAMFTDPTVQLSTLMGLVSETQAMSHSEDAIQLMQVGGQWIIDGSSGNVSRLHH